MQPGTQTELAIKDRLFKHLMRRGSKYGPGDEVSSWGPVGDRDAADQSAMAEVLKASSAAVAALADTLNALILRIALARTAGGIESENYGRLARLAASASEQVKGIQQLLGTIEGAVLRKQSSQIRPSGRRSRP